MGFAFWILLFSSWLPQYLIDFIYRPSGSFWNFPEGLSCPLFAHLTSIIIIIISYSYLSLSFSYLSAETGWPSGHAFLNSKFLTMCMQTTLCRRRHLQALGPMGFDVWRVVAVIALGPRPMALFATCTALYRERQGHWPIRVLWPKPVKRDECEKEQDGADYINAASNTQGLQTGYIHVLKITTIYSIWMYLVPSTIYRFCGFVLGTHLKPWDTIKTNCEVLSRSSGMTGRVNLMGFQEFVASWRMW